MGNECTRQNVDEHLCHSTLQDITNQEWVRDCKSRSSKPLNPMKATPKSHLSHVLEGDNIQNVSEYAGGVFALLLKEEYKFLPRPNYMDQQKDVNAVMRAILIDWLVDVHLKNGFRHETLYLAVNYFDRYLAIRPVAKQRLQLVGTAAMFIAAKFEEALPGTVDDYTYVTDNTYTTAELLDMECQMLTSLGFHLSVPTAAHFMDRLQRLNGCDNDHKFFIQYLTELALLDVRMLRYPPSQVVCAAILVSNLLLGRVVPWTHVIQDHVRHGAEELRPCAEALRALLSSAEADKQQAIRRKYSRSQYHQVAIAWPRSRVATASHLGGA